MAASPTASSARISSRSKSELVHHDANLSYTLADPRLARSRQTVARINLVPQAESVGRVERVGDGIALVSGCRTPVSTSFSASTGVGWASP